MLRLRFAILVAVVAVTSHDATYLIGYGLDGYPAALGATGHDGHWLPVAVGVAGLLLAAATVAATRWWRLRSQLAELGDAPDARIGPVVPPALRLAVRLFAAALAVFVIQENLEAIAIGAPAPGVGVILSAAYLGAVPALAAIALLFALVSELVDARLHRLERAIEAARRRLPRRPARTASRPSRGARLPLSSSSSRPDLGRAPPASAHA